MLAEVLKLTLAKYFLENQRVLQVTLGIPDQLIEGLLRFRSLNDLNKAAAKGEVIEHDPLLESFLLHVLGSQLDKASLLLADYLTNGLADWLLVFALSYSVLLPNLPLVPIVANSKLVAGRVHKNIGQF